MKSTSYIFDPTQWHSVLYKLIHPRAIFSCISNWTVQITMTTQVQYLINYNTSNQSLGCEKKYAPTLHGRRITSISVMGHKSKRQQQTKPATSSLLWFKSHLLCLPKNVIEEEDTTTSDDEVQYVWSLIVRYMYCIPAPTYRYVDLQIWAEERPT